jgi:hypothetical protein
VIGPNWACAANCCLVIQALQSAWLEKLPIVCHFERGLSVAAAPEAVSGGTSSNHPRDEPVFPTDAQPAKTSKPRTDANRRFIMVPLL